MWASRDEGVKPEPGTSWYLVCWLGWEFWQSSGGCRLVSVVKYRGCFTVTVVVDLRIK